MPAKKTEHALLSASSADRWLHCTRAPRLEELQPENTNEYAAEGTLAHAIGELKLRKKFFSVGTKVFKAEMKKLKADPLYQEEMQRHTDTYLDYVTESAMRFPSTPHVAIETRVDFSDIAPGGFGTCDCLMLGGDTLHIIDFKYGKRMPPVSADHNPQMMLYAFGALRTYLPIFGDTVKHIHMSIVQPRLDNISTWQIERDDLIDWGVLTVRPTAETAYKGEGDFCPGDWCHFCRVYATCRACSEKFTALEDFKYATPPLLADTEVGVILAQAQALKSWVTAVEDYALKAILSGQDIPGWKAVEGISRRKFSDVDGAFEVLKQHGYDEAVLYERKPITLAAAEKLVGRTDFKDLLADYVIKPPGAPTLVPAGDKRPPIHSAAADFEGIA